MKIKQAKKYKSYEPHVSTIKDDILIGGLGLTKLRTDSDMSTLWTGINLLKRKQ
uniref:Uncharacterized protein n=1 Tax=Arundo donax TaxID=35708 RepID=A0A0A8Z194_ARUDO